MATKNTNKNASANADAKVKVTMALNEAKEGVELTFSVKPSAQVREALKHEGFKWNSKAECWYAKQSKETLAFAKTLASTTVEAAEPTAKVESKKPSTKGKGKSKGKKAEAPAKVEVVQKPIAFDGKVKASSKKLFKALNEIDGLTAEMDRTWLWVSGDTRTYKDALKAMGFSFGGKRQAWYLKG